MTQSLSFLDTFSNFRRLFASFPRKRKFQFFLLLVLQVLSSFSEVLSLGAIVPFLSAVTNLDGFLENQMVASIVSYFGVSDRSHIIGLFALVFAVAVAMANLLRFFTLRYVLKLTAWIGTDLATLIFRRTLHRPYPYFVQNNSSNIISGMTNDLGDTLSSVYNVLMLLIQSIMIVTIGFALLLYNPLVAAGIGAVVLSGYALIIVIVNKRLKSLSLVRSDRYRHMIKTMQESIGGIRHIIMDGTRDNFIDHYNGSDTIYRQSMAEHSLIAQAPRFFVETLGVLSIAGLVIILSGRSADISHAIPLLGFLGLASYRLLPAVQQFYGSLSTISGLRVALSRTVEMMTADKTPSHYFYGDPMPFSEALEVDDLSFSYGGTDDQLILDSVSFSIKSGQTVAFVGRTGSGKSTMADLLLGLIEPQSGFIKVDGIEVNSEAKASWQKSVSSVSQNIFLADCSIAENIAFGLSADDIDRDQIVRAAKMAHIDNFIGTLPGGYDEVVGESGVRLSGGQRQRIGVARALYKRCSLLVFDEATSALDNNTEDDLMQSLDGLSDDLTIILIAHRLSTVKRADNIFVFDQGRIVDQGTYDQLMKSSDIFKKLTKTEGVDKV